MPKREDETYRNVNPHPPACTCVDCVNQHLAGQSRLSPPTPPDRGRYFIWDLRS